MKRDWFDNTLLVIIILIVLAAILLGGVFFIARAPGVWKVLGGLMFVVPIYFAKNLIKKIFAKEKKQEKLENKKEEDNA